PGTPSKSRYTVELDREDPWDPAPAAAAHVQVSFESSSVAAYWSAGQRVSGQVTVTNSGTGTADLDLDAVTSDVRWTATLAQPTVSLAPGASTTVGVDLVVPPDAWANVPVRVSVRARDGSGAQATGHVEITPGPLTAPVHPEQVWPVPAALLGGL